MVNEATFALELALKVTLLLAAAFCSARLFRRRSAAERHLLWVVVTCGVLALPFLSGGLPTWRVSIGSLSGIVPTSAWPSAGVSPAFETDAVTGRGENAHRSATHGLPLADADVGPTPAASGQLSLRSAEVEAASVSGATIAWLIWLAGALASGGALVFSFYRVHRIAAAARPTDDPALLRLAEETCSELALHRPVRLLEGAADAMPMTFGLLRSQLLLPSVARTWTVARQRAVLRHELAHVERRDAWTQLVAELCCALHWYNPLMWLAARRMYVEREHACDDVVLAGGGRATDYAAELIEIARTMRTRRGTAAAAVAMARDSHLRARTLALLDGRRRRARPSYRLLVPAWLGAFALVTTLASLAPDYARPAEQAPQTRAPAPLFGLPASMRQAPPAPPASLPETTTPAPASSATLLGPLVSQASDCLAGSRSNHMHSNASNGRRTIKWSGRDCSGEVIVDGDVHFDAAFTTITGVSRGGEFRIDVTDGRDRRLLVIRGGNGGATYDYRHNGERREFDADAQRWLDEQLLFLFRRVGFMAQDRARSMLAQRGHAAVLGEVEHLGSDHARAAYLGIAVSDGQLDEQSLRRVLTLAGGTLSSDHYRTQVITAAAGRYEFTGGVQAAYIDAVSRISSDHYRHGAFSTLLQQGQLSPAQVSAVLNESERIRSDHYRAQLLGELAGSYGMTPEIRPAYLRAAAGISSDHYKHRVLANLLDSGQLSAADQVGVVQAAATIRSDHYRRQLLSGVASRADLSPAVLAEVLNAARTINSDHHKAELLVEIASTHAVRGTTRDQLLDVMDSIRSTTQRGRVAEAMLRTDR